MTFTPRRFGLLQGALRDTYELIAALPGQDALAAQVLDRVGRLNKLVLNGWDDRNQNQIVDWPGECAQLGTGPDGQPMGKGGLQMAERTLLRRDRLARAVHAGRRRSRHHHRSRARLRARDLGGQAPLGAGQLRDVHADAARSLTRGSATDRAERSSSRECLEGFHQLGEPPSDVVGTSPLSSH